MKTVLAILTTCLLVLPIQAKYSGGSGTPQAPYQIATAADLIALGATPDDYHKLVGCAPHTDSLRWVGERWCAEHTLPVFSAPPRLGASPFLAAAGGRAGLAVTYW